MASGKRRHQPVVITKKWGISSPQFFQACVTGETLKLVVIEFMRINPQGQKYIYQIIRFTDAKIISVRQYANMLNLGDPLATTRPPDLEDISFTFKKIEFLNKDGNTAATDDWGQPPV
jgi:type VI secretion system secreted protein Hcp